MDVDENAREWCHERDCLPVSFAKVQSLSVDLSLTCPVS